MIGKKVSLVCKKVSNGVRKVRLGCGSSSQSVVSVSAHEQNDNPSQNLSAQAQGTNPVLSCNKHGLEESPSTALAHAYHPNSGNHQHTKYAQTCAQLYTMNQSHCNHGERNAATPNLKQQCPNVFGVPPAHMHIETCPAHSPRESGVSTSQRLKRNFRNMRKFHRTRKDIYERCACCQCTHLRFAHHPIHQPCSLYCHRNAHQDPAIPNNENLTHSFSLIHPPLPWMVPNPLSEWLSTAKQIHGAQCAQNIPCSCGLHSNTTPEMNPVFNDELQTHQEKHLAGAKRTKPEGEEHDTLLKRMKQNPAPMSNDNDIQTKNAPKSINDGENQRKEVRKGDSFKDAGNADNINNIEHAIQEPASSLKHEDKGANESVLNSEGGGTVMQNCGNGARISSNVKESQVIPTAREQPSESFADDGQTLEGQPRIRNPEFDDNLKNNNGSAKKSNFSTEKKGCTSNEIKRASFADSFHADGFAAPPTTPHKLSTGMNVQSFENPPQGDYVGSDQRLGEPVTTSRLNAFSRSLEKPTKAQENETDGKKKTVRILDCCEQVSQKWPDMGPENFNNVYASPYEQALEAPKAPFISADDVEDIGYEMYPEGEHMEFSTPQGQFIARPSNEAVASAIRKAPLEEIVDALSRRPRYCAEYGGTPSRRRVARWVETPACFDDFRVEGLLGRGGYGVVLEVSPLRGAVPRGPLPTRMALKVVPLTGMDRPAYNSLMNEIRVHAGVPPHPCVLRVLLSFRERAVHFFGMPLLSGGSLYDAWERAGRKIPGPAALRAIQQTLAGVAHLHAYGWAHMDIKPDNIMLAWQRDEARGDDAMPALKLIDFSLAQRFNVNDEDDWADNWRGTEAYMSPQVWELCHSPPKSDMYSIGVTMYVLVTGFLPKGKVRTGSDEHFHIMETEDYIFDDREWKSCDRRMMNLCRQLLSYNERKRPTAAHALAVVNDILRSFVPISGDGKPVNVDSAIPPGFECKKTVMTVSTMPPDENHVDQQKAADADNTVGQPDLERSQQIGGGAEFDGMIDEDEYEPRIRTL